MRLEEARFIMKKQQYVVFGLNRFGASVARTLAASGIQVLAVDQDAERVARIADEVSYAVQADVADEEAMDGLGLAHMDGAVIAVADNMEASIVIAMKCKECGIPQIVATGKNEVHGKVLEKLGVNRVVYPEREMGVRVGKYLTARDFSDWINLSRDYSMVEMEIPEDWVGKSLKELDLRKRFGMNIAGIRVGNHMDLQFSPDEKLKKDMMLYVIGRDRDLERFRGTR